MATSWPTLTVKVAFASNPFDTAPTWTDVSQYVRSTAGLFIDRGRADPWSPATVGTCSLTLSNLDRRFDSTYAAGPYFGNLKPRRQIWVYATWLGVDYDLFKGFVGAWPQTFGEGGMDAMVKLTCYDGLDYLGSARLATEPYADYVNANFTPILWLRQADASTWDDAMDSVYQPQTSGTVPFASTMVPGVKSSAVSFNSQSYFGVPPMDSYSPTDWTLSFWIRTTAPPGTEIMHYSTPVIGAGAGTNAMIVALGSSISTIDGALIYYTNDSDGTFMRTWTSRAINDGNPHLIHICRKGSTGTEVQLYVDGVLDTAAGTFFSGAPTNRWGRLEVIGGGAPTNNSFANPGTLTTATTLQDLMLMSSAITPAQALAVYNFGIGAVVESATVRTTRYLDDVAWPSAWRDLTTIPVSTVNTLVYNNQQAITALQEVERSEQGRFFVAKNGFATLHYRYHHLTVTRGSTSQATFSDDGTTTSYYSFGYSEDDTQVRNDITVNNTGSTTRSTDSTSITSYSRRSETVPTILSSLTQVKDLAAGLVYWWKDQAIRIEEFAVAYPTSFAVLFGLELGDRITTKMTPMKVGSQLSKELIIDRIRWEIFDYDWRMFLGGSPVKPGTFVLDSATLGVLDTNVLSF